MSKKNYVEGWQLLREIEASKANYSSIADGYTLGFDASVSTLSEITPERIEELREEKAKKERFTLRKAAKARGVKNTSAEYRTIGDGLAESYKLTDFVFRFPTYEHAPKEFVSVSATRKRDPIERFNFAPFKQFVLNEDGELVEVARSHWKGPIEGGSFCTEHGRLTDKLGIYISRIVDRYGRRGNLRGYSYLDDMKSEVTLHLVNKILKFDETQSNNPFAYVTRIVENNFKRAITNEKRHQNLRDALLESAGFTGSFKSQSREED